MERFGNYGSSTDSKNVAYEIYGDRFHTDQTLYEYLIEFLLIFCSPKSDENNYSEGRMAFHKEGDDLHYFAEIKMGLKRFIFYNASKKTTSIPFDKDAYNYLLEALQKKMDLDSIKTKETVSYLQDLLRGYAVVLKKRSWCAQQTLPICPELIFPEAMPNQKERLKVVGSGDDIKVDSKFEFAQRNFLARGGEVYYLHILQALQNMDESEKEELEYLLSHLLTQQSRKLSMIARFVQDTWIDRLHLTDTQTDLLYQEYNLAWIPADAYGDAGKYTVEELISFLSANIQQINKIEIFAQGLMLQVLRMLYTGACNKAHLRQKPWIIDMSNGNSKNIKKISSRSFRQVEDDFRIAISETVHSKLLDEKETLQRIKDAQKVSLDIFRSKGKEMRCIIPVSGPFERFTLSEDVLRFLVLAIIEPGGKMTLDSFMNKIYQHFNIVVGPKQYRIACQNILQPADAAEANMLEENVKYFQSYLNSIGCLKELSDATSIVMNSYSKVERE